MSMKHVNESFTTPQMTSQCQVVGAQVCRRFGVAAGGGIEAAGRGSAYHFWHT
jgi:hypothetical protein